MFTVELNLEDADWLFLGLLHVILICGEVWILSGIVRLWFLLHDFWMINTWSRHAWVFVARSSGSGGAWVSAVLWQLLLASAVWKVSAPEWVLCWASTNSRKRSLLSAHPINTSSRFLSWVLSISSGRNRISVYLRLESQLISLLFEFEVSWVLRLSSLPSSVLLETSFAHSSLVLQWLSIVRSVIDLWFVWVLSIVLLGSHLSIINSLVLFLSLHFGVLVEQIRPVVVCPW